MAAKDDIKKEIATLSEEGIELLRRLTNEKKGVDIRFDYQRWYSKALKVVQSLAPDRYTEFRLYYEPDPKRKSLDYGTYVMQDYFKGVVPNRVQYSNFDSKVRAAINFLSQISILQSLVERVDSALANIETTMLAELQGAELTTARHLLSVNIRAAGALAGVVLEGHLQKVAESRGVKIGKKDPTLGDLNELLKQTGVYDIPTWRKLSYLADIRNLCSHKKGADPTEDQVKEFIEGVNWAIKNLT